MSQNTKPNMITHSFKKSFISDINPPSCIAFCKHSMKSCGWVFPLCVLECHDQTPRRGCESKREKKCQNYTSNKT